MSNGGGEGPLEGGTPELSITPSANTPPVSPAAFGELQRQVDALRHKVERTGVDHLQSQIEELKTQLGNTVSAVSLRCSAIEGNVTSLQRGGTS